MELKQNTLKVTKYIARLLIVLHGIETQQVQPVFGASGLLIVLHGIETTLISL